MSTEFSGHPGIRPEAGQQWTHEGEGPPTSFDENAWTEDYAYEETGSVSRLQIDDRQLSQALGWLSIGLGVAELLAPRALGRAIGVGDHPALIRALGVREIVSGVGLLSERAPGAWAWSRAAGDVMDLALLGAALRSPDAQPQRIGAAAGFVLGAAALDVYAGQRLSQSQMEPPEIRVSEVVAINETPQALYAFWSNLENLPLFMSHLKSVSKTSERTSHWVAKGPVGTTIEWDSELVDDQQDVRLGWRTLPDSEIRHEGIVTFEPAPGGRGTIARVEMIYWPPAGKVGAQFARLLGEEPRTQINDDLRKLKQLIETGEVATTLGQPSGKRSLIGRATLGGWLQ
jgi:uncharacterized membrane protein